MNWLVLFEFYLLIPQTPIYKTRARKTNEKIRVRKKKTLFSNVLSIFIKSKCYAETDLNLNIILTLPVPIPDEEKKLS